MPDLSKYDLDFRPKTYWDLRDVLTQIEDNMEPNTPIKLSHLFIQSTFPQIS